MSKYDELKREVLDSGIWLAEHGYLGELTSGGNLSVRLAGEDVVAITPSGRSYYSLELEDICVIDLDLQPIEEGLPPSIESGVHAGIYKNRPDVNAIIHTHQPYANTLAIINKPIPALFDEITVEIGHEVAMVPYAYSGSAELVSNVVGKLDNACHCYLIQNHGALCFGVNMKRAMKNAELLEQVARIYCQALATGKKINLLPTSAIEYFAEKRKTRFE